MVAGIDYNPAKTEALPHEGASALIFSDMSMLSTMGQIGHCSRLCISVKSCLTPARFLTSLHPGTHKDCRLIVFWCCLPL